MTTIVPDWLRAQQEQYTRQNRGIAGIDPSATPTGISPQALEKLRASVQSQIRPQATPAGSVGFGNLRGPFADILGSRLGGFLQGRTQNNLASLLGGATQQQQPSNSLAALQERIAKARAGLY